MLEGALAKLQKLNMEQTKTLTVFLYPATPSNSYSYQPYIDRGRTYNKRGSSGKGGGQKTKKTVSSATVTKLSKESQVLTLMVPQDTSKHKVEKTDCSPLPTRSHIGKGSAKVSEKLE